eukprot:6112437-Amphidinium_carterae.1
MTQPSADYSNSSAFCEEQASQMGLDVAQVQGLADKGLNSMAKLASHLCFTLVCRRMMRLSSHLPGRCSEQTLCWALCRHSVVCMTRHSPFWPQRYHRERNCYRPGKMMGELFCATVTVTVTQKYSESFILN